MKKHLLVSIPLLALLSACSTTQKLDPNYLAYLKAQQNAMKAQPKIVEIDAQPGQPIILSGVKKFIVYAPRGNTAGSIRVYHPAPNPATVIFSKLFDTALDGAKSILPAYFGWHYGSHILTRAFDRAGGNYNVTGDYNTGTMTKVTGDYTTGTKYNVQGSYAGADQVQGNKVGQNNYQPGQDLVGQNKAGQDVTGQSKYQAGQDYTAGNKAGQDNVGQDNNQNSNNTTNTTSDNSTSG